MYAGCKVDNQNRLFEIREKHSFETDKTTGHHSAGIYYFKHARYIKHYFPLLMAKNQRVNNEFYVSMIYQLMLNDQKHINVYDQISHFCQWGTPEDLAEYLYYFESVKGYSS